MELWESLSSIKDTTLGINTYISFKTYLDEVAKDPKHEHATLLIDYEDEDHTRVLTEVFHGTEDNVIQLIPLTMWQPRFTIIPTAHLLLRRTCYLRQK